MFETSTQPQRTATRWDRFEGDAIRAHKRQANEYMRDALRLLDPDETIPFFCECESTECFAAVFLSGDSFDRVRAARDRGLDAHGEALRVPARV